MLVWLFNKGIRIEPTAQYPDEILRQLIFYWHLLDHDIQKWLCEVKPVYNFNFKAPQITNIENKAGLDMEILDDGTITCVILYTQEAQLYQPAVKPELVFKRNTMIDSSHLGLKNYNGSTTFTMLRWDQRKLISDPWGATNWLCPVFTWAHEMTHGLQRCFAPLKADNMAMAEWRTRFLLLSGSLETKICHGILNVNEYAPQNVQIMVQPQVRPLGGASPIQRVAVPGGKWAFLHGEKIVIAVNAAPKIKECLTLCSTFEFSSGQGKIPIVDLATNTLDPNLFLQMMIAEFKQVIIVLMANQEDRGLEVDVDQFFIKWKAIQKYLSTTINGQVDADMPKFGGLLDLAVALEYPSSILDAVYTLIDANQNANISLANVGLLKTYILQLQRSAMTGIRHAVNMYRKKIEICVQMQKQQCTLFPHLVGHFTEYVNGIFYTGIDYTQRRLAPLLLGQDDKNVLVFLPKPVQEWIQIIISKNKFTNLNDAKEVVPVEKWYELGAQMGFFIRYTMEYDAEATAMFLCCPEELVDMYTRNNNAKGALDEVMNQVTYIAYRGWEEKGDVPKYHD